MRPRRVGLPNIAEPRKCAISKKGLLAVGLLIGGLVGISALGIHRFAASGKRSSTEESKLVRDKPAAASTEPRTLEMPASPTFPSSAATTAATSAASIKVPAITPTDEEMAEPIGVRRTGSGPVPGKGAKGSKDLLPEDAPVLLVSSRPGTAPAAGSASRTPTATASAEQGDAEPDPHDPLAATSRNLQAYQRQLQGLLDNLTHSAELAIGSGNAPTPPAAQMAGFALAGGTAANGSSGGSGGLFGGQLQGSSTPKVAAGMLGNASLTLNELTDLER